MSNQRIIVLITTPNQEVAHQIASRLVEKQLAACGNIVPNIHSIFHWQGEVQQEEEALLILKTRPELLHTHLIPEVKALHPYTTPEIITLPILDGSSDYLEWIDQLTQPK